MAKAIGTVTNLMGTANATSADGSIRQLNVGDKVFQNDLINTNAAGAIEIEFVDGNVMALGRDSQALLDIEYFSAAESLAVTPEVDSMDIDAIQQALLDGADPTIVAQATAAGAGAQESEGGHQAVFVDYLAPEVAVQAGFETNGVIADDNDAPEFFFDEEDGLFPVDSATSGTTFVTPLPSSGLPPETEVLPLVNDGGNLPSQESPENPDVPNDGEQQPNPSKPETTDGNNGVGNGSEDDQPPGNPPLNDGEESQPGNPDNQDNQSEDGSNDPEDLPSQGGPNGDNGFGNGDQDAPGNSADNNNAENSNNSGQGNSGQGQQANSNNQPEDEPLNAEDLVTEETEALFPEDQQSDGGPKGNNGHGNGDQNAPGNSSGNNNAENSDNAGQGNSGKGQGGGLGQGVNYNDIANSVLDNGGENGLM